MNNLPEYAANKIAGKWYATRREKIASEAFTTKKQAEEATMRRMDSDLRIDGLPVDSGQKSQASEVTLMQSQFSIGDKVKAIALPTAWPHPRPEVPNLTVTNVRLIESAYLPPYYRVEAHGPDGFSSVEGAERFFEAS